jgi:hypothetical protein
MLQRIPIIPEKNESTLVNTINAELIIFESKKFDPFNKKEPLAPYNVIRLVKYIPAPPAWAKIAVLVKEKSEFEIVVTL